MRGLSFLFLLIPALSIQALEYPKNMTDSISVRIEKGFWATKFRQGASGTLLKLNSVQEVVGRYPDSKPDVTASRMWMYPGLVAGGAGGFLVGFFGMQAILGQDLNAPAFFSGVGLIATSIVFSKFAEARLVRAVEKYNAVLPEDLGLDWGISPERSKLAIQLRF